MKVAQYGTASSLRCAVGIVVFHAVPSELRSALNAHELHSLAHAQIPIPFSLLQLVFISIVI